MTTDLDQGGSTTEYANIEVGPTIGWQKTPVPPSIALSSSWINLQSLNVLPGASGAANAAALSTALNGNHGTLFYLPIGNYNIGSTVIISPNVKAIWGPGTFVWTGGNATQTSLLFSFGGFSYLDIFNLGFDCTNGPTKVSGIALNDNSGAMTNLHIHGCTFTGGRNIISVACPFTTGSVIYIEDNIASTWTFEGMFVTGSTDLYLRRNRLIGNNASVSDAFEIEVLGNYVDITDNYLFKYGTAFGIYTQDIASGSKINGNSLVDGILDSIQVAASTLNVKGFEVCNNIMDNPTVTGGDLGIGLLADGALTVSNGLVSGNLIRKRGAMGVFLQARSGVSFVRDNVISNNYIIDPCQTFTGTAGIEVDGSAAGSTINNYICANVIFSDDTKMNWGIREQTGGGTVHNYYFNNQIVGAQTARTSLQGGSSTSGNTFP